MRWVNWGLWVSAWGCWVGLGIGLHRELPRTVGPTLSRIPLGEREHPLVLVGDGELLATFEIDSARERYIVRAWNIVRRERLSESILPGLMLSTTQFSVRHGVVVALMPGMKRGV